MQIVYHIGANCTDGERLLRSLMKDLDRLSRAGVHVPGPGRYRKVLRETIQSLGPGPDDPAPGTRDVLLDAILDGTTARRLVMSQPTFLSLPVRIFDNGRFYPQTRTKIRAVRSMFPDDDLQFHIGLRNPATFIPAAFAQSGSQSVDTFMDGVDPRAVRWSDVIARIRDAAPDASLTVWCNEDTLLIWGELLRRLSGFAPEETLSGAHDLLATTMTPDGMTRFIGYMKSHPGQSEAQIRLVIGAFLDKYAIPEEVEEEVDLPGWDMALVEELTRLYEADVALIGAMDGVDFVAP
jgi:hypothetical protein